MQFKPPKNTGEFFWTSHALGKMRYYGLSARKIIQIIRSPLREEEGIAENTVAVMQPASGAKQKIWKSEIWAMYQLKNGQKKIISAWRYPGVSPKKDYLPSEILAETKKIINNGE